MTEQMTVIFFKLLNFVVLFGLILYVVKVYLMPDLRAQMAKYIAYLAGLRSSHRALKKDERKLQEAIRDDTKQQEQLKENVKRWQSVVNEQREDLLREREDRKGVLLKRFEEYKGQIALYRTYKQVAPEAIEQARRELEKRFAQDAAQRKFIKKIVLDMRKQ
ncbi:hypothetical protein E3J61_03505 [Candidatus Dependentiae bacterium]|nr:MAG: hypothetical protein E3J61_03505 [Candidatus Dependentiae bacterium]